MTDRLYPKTHLIQSIRNRGGFTLNGAIHEFCDNAIGHGEAETIHITIGPEQIVIHDDGIGIDQIDRIFRLADASSHGKLSEIGQYGVGATDSAIFNGDHLHVSTVRDGRYHQREVDWRVVERSGLWPLPYRGRGVAYKDSLEAQQIFPTGHGARITISKLHRRRQAITTIQLADHLGLIFMPALRAGRRIHLAHIDTRGVSTSGWAVPFIPADLTDIDQISGSIDDEEAGVMRWRGRVGSSMTLTKKTNAVFFWFAHRVIEATPDPFHGASVPTLYAEVELIAEDGWKYALADHKDQIVRYREELMESVHTALAERIKAAEQQGYHLALRGVVAPIELKLTMALMAKGILFVDPTEDAEAGGGGDKPGGGGAGGSHRQKLRTPQSTGASAKPLEKAVGVHIRFGPDSEMDGMPYLTRLSAYKLEVVLREAHYKGIFKFPPTQRDRAITELVVAMLCRGIEIEVLKTENPPVMNALKPSLRSKIKPWFMDGELAPRLHAEFTARIAKVGSSEESAE